MSVVSLLNVSIRNNPAPIDGNYEFEITFECLEPLQNDLEWKLIYVGSATSAEHDQELDSLLVGPIPVGVSKFLFEADAPNFQRIPSSEILGVTVILLTCSYDGREFVRVGYYVNNEYTEPELNDDPPAKPIIEKIRRQILADKPRVTRFAIKWDSEESAPALYPPEQPEADTAEDDEEAYGREEVAAEEEEVVEVEPAPVAGDEDAKMDGMKEEITNGTAVNEEDDAGSEDLEAETSGSDDEEDEEDEEEEEEGQGQGADEMDTAEDIKGAPNGAAPSDQQEGMGQHQQSRQAHTDVMVH